MDKDQCHVQTLRTLYLHGILSLQDLFMAKRSILKRASQWSLNQMIMLSSSWDIGKFLWDIFGTIWKIILRASGGHLDCQNQSSIPRVMVQMKFVTERVVHRPCSSCISSIQNLIRTPSSSPCQLRLRVWLSYLKLSHYIFLCYTFS